MSILFAVRIFADLCLYAALAGSVGGMNQQTVALWIPAAICALAAGLGCLLRQRSVRIAALLSEKAFSFSVKQYLGIHRRLFEGIYPHAGKVREYNISKRE